MCEESDFDILDDILRVDDEPPKTECEHEYEANNCIKCGEHIRNPVDKVAWSENVNTFTRRTVNEKTIFQDVHGLGLNDVVVNLANEIYQNVTHNKTIRGRSRRGIVCTCVYYASNKLEPNIFSFDEVIKIFKIDNKVALKGFKFVNSTNNYAFTCFTTTPETYIRLFLKKFSMSSENIAEVLTGYKSIGNIELSSRPRPQSVAAAFIYYWLQDHYPGRISLSTLAIETGVSQLTIEKIEREIREKMI